MNICKDILWAGIKIFFTTIIFSVTGAADFFYKNNRDSDIESCIITLTEPTTPLIFHAQPGGTFLFMGCFMWQEMKMNIHKNKMLWYNTRCCIRASYERSWNIRKDLKSKELGKGISQESTGLYSARFVDRFGKRKHKRFKKLQECRAWIADATYVDEHSDISMPSDMLVDHGLNIGLG